MSVIHAWSQFAPKDPDTVRRNAVAAMSWSRQLWKECPIKVTALSRTFKCGEAVLPYIRDLLDIAAQGTSHHTILVLTNADTIVASDATLRIVCALQNRDVAYAFRRDWYHRMGAPPADEDFAKGTDYPGSDLFACRVRWWMTYRAHWPDMLLGREAWDLCLRVLMEATCMSKPLSLPDLICHERHNNGWEHPSIRYRLPSQRHNLALAKAFLARYNVNFNAGVHNIRTR